jgi:hypothetical protein
LYAVLSKRGRPMAYHTRGVDFSVHVAVDVAAKQPTFRASSKVEISWFRKNSSTLEVLRQLQARAEEAAMASVSSVRYCDVSLYSRLCLLELLER